MLRRRTRSSQTREKGNNQVSADLNRMGGMPAQGPDVGNTGVNENKTHVPEQDCFMQGIHELHGVAQSSYRELQGSPAPYRRELP